MKLSASLIILFYTVIILWLCQFYWFFLCAYMIMQIDSLDTLALLGDRERFGAAVEWVGRNVRFDIVSLTVFLKLV